MIKIGIVGVDGTKWTKGQEEIVKEWIRHILHDKLAKLNYDKESLTVVSGHCPVGEELWYCIDCDEWMAEESTKYFLHKQDEIQSKHRLVKVFDKGGVDTIVEIVATELGIKKEIHPAFQNKWLGDKIKDAFRNDSAIKSEGYEAVKDYGGEEPIHWIGHIGRRVGFKARNIQIAESPDVLYDIEPKGSCRHCGGTGRVRSYIPRWVAGGLIRESESLLRTCKWCKGTGVYSGGTWTMRYAENLGKEVHQIVIN